MTAPTERGRDVQNVSLSAGYERRDVHVRALVFCAIALTLACTVVGVVIMGLLEKWENEHLMAQAARSRWANTEQPPEPHLQANPRAELMSQRKNQNNLLQGSGVIDEEKGIVHIPIDQAMTLVVEHGWSAVKSGEKAAATQEKTDTEAEKAKP